MNSFFKEFIIPLYEYKLLEKKIVIYPVENLNNLNPKELIAFSFIPEKAFIKLKGAKRVSIKTKISSEEKEQIKKFLDKTKRVISVLIYDIRSSTFMSLSLLDAEKELSVKREFQKIMKETVISNGGFPVKETGDGGIAFFAENSGELYRYIYEESVLMGTNIRFQKALQPSLKIESSPLSAYKALKCAIEMTKKSEEFIRKNYTNYRGWFPDVLGKDNPVKSLFRLGIGITSASNEKEIFLSFNAFGDYDVQGPALNIATILSEVRDPFSSSILIDHKTFSSLLQNTRDIGIYCPPENIEDFLELFDKPKVFELKKELYRLKNTGFVDLEEFLKEKMYKKEKIYSIKIDEDFLYINEKRGVMVYECKR
jgi:class 3 adenylate cyclase